MFEGIDSVKMDAIKARFWAKVRKSDGCWEWTASYGSTGYGQMMNKAVSGKPMKAHRVSFMLNVGPIGDGLHVCHRCDNPKCVRPDHLFLGTNADNQADKVSKNRAYRPTWSGRECYQTKLYSWNGEERTAEEWASWASEQRGFTIVADAMDLRIRRHGIEWALTGPMRPRKAK